MTRAEAEVKVEVAQSCPTLCDPMDYEVHGILQARTLEWVTVPFPRGSSQPRDRSRSPTLQADSLPGKPKNTEWVAYGFSSGSFPRRDPTGVCCTEGGFLASWATGDSQRDSSAGLQTNKRQGLRTTTRWRNGNDSACQCGDAGLVSGLGRSPGAGNGSPLQCSCLENPMDGGAWWATVHGGAKSWTRLSD